MGNHDNKRIASKFNPKRIDLFNILIKTLPGIAVTYYVIRLETCIKKLVKNVWKHL